MSDNWNVITEDSKREDNITKIGKKVIQEMTLSR